MTVKEYFFEKKYSEMPFQTMPLFTSKQIPDAPLCISVKLCNVYNSPHFSNTTHTETLKTREI